MGWIKSWISLIGLIHVNSIYPQWNFKTPDSYSNLFGYNPPAYPIMMFYYPISRVYSQGHFHTFCTYPRSLWPIGKFSLAVFAQVFPSSKIYCVFRIFSSVRDNHFPSSMRPFHFLNLLAPSRSGINLGHSEVLYCQVLNSLLILTLFSMENIWNSPAINFVKISVHCVILELPLPNGNSVAVGIIIRNNRGKKLWGAMGPLHGMTEAEAIIWGMHAGAVQALKLGEQKVHFDIDNEDVYDVIRFQDEIVVVDELVEPLSQFNTLHNNHFNNGLTARRLSWVDVEMNRVAEYMATYGLENLKTYVEIPGDKVFGDLQHLMDRDMGLAPPDQMVEAVEVFGLGEVIDGPPPVIPPVPKPLHPLAPPVRPCAPKRAKNLSLGPASPLPAVGRKNLTLNVNLCLNSGLASGMPRPIPNQVNSSSKGKEKVLSGYSFNKDGLMDKEAIRILDSGELIGCSKDFEKNPVDLEAKDSNGRALKDILEDHMLKLSTAKDPASHPFISVELSDSANPLDNSFLFNQDMMDVDQILLEWEKYDVGRA